MQSERLCHLVFLSHRLIPPIDRLRLPTFSTILLLLLAADAGAAHCCRGRCCCRCEQECMERGISLVPLTVTGLSTGLYGRACVTVGDPKGRPLPAHRLSAGDQVRLHSTKGSKGTKGNGIEEGVSEISGRNVRPVCTCTARISVCMILNERALLY